MTPVVLTISGPEGQQYTVEGQCLRYSDGARKRRAGMRAGAGIIFGVGFTLIPGPHQLVTFWLIPLIGFGLAMMIEILSGVLSGGLFGRDVPTMTAYGQDPLISSGFYVAIDVERFLPLAEFRSRVDRLVEQARETEPIDEDQPVLVAGDKELACRETRLEQGVPLSHQVADELDELLDRFELSQVARLRSAR